MTTPTERLIEFQLRRLKRADRIFAVVIYTTTATVSLAVLWWFIR